MYCDSIEIFAVFLDFTAVLYILNFQFLHRQEEAYIIQYGVLNFDKSNWKKNRTSKNTYRKGKNHLEK